MTYRFLVWSGFLTKIFFKNFYLGLGNQPNLASFYASARVNQFDDMLELLNFLFGALMQTPPDAQGIDVHLPNHETKIETHAL